MKTQKQERNIKRNYKVNKVICKHGNRKKKIKKLHCKQINMQTQKHERNNAKKSQCKQNDM